MCRRPGELIVALEKDGRTVHDDMQSYISHLNASQDAYIFFVSEQATLPTP